jgi:hypothetical protein
VIQPDIVVMELIERYMNDHIWEMAPLLGIVEANTWEMAPLGMLLFWQCILAATYWPQCG